MLDEVFGRLGHLLNTRRPFLVSFKRWAEQMRTQGSAAHNLFTDNGVKHRRKDLPDTLEDPRGCTNAASVSDGAE